MDINIHKLLDILEGIIRSRKSQAPIDSSIDASTYAIAPSKYTLNGSARMPR